MVDTNRSKKQQNFSNADTVPVALQLPDSRQGSLAARRGSSFALTVALPCIPAAPSDEDLRPDVSSESERDTLFDTARRALHSKRRASGIRPDTTTRRGSGGNGNGGSADSSGYESACADSSNNTSDESFLGGAQAGPCSDNNGGDVKFEPIREASDNDDDEDNVPIGRLDAIVYHALARTPGSAWLCQELKLFSDEHGG